MFVVGNFDGRAAQFFPGARHERLERGVIFGATYLINVIARATDDERGDIATLRSLQVPIPGGRTVPVTQFVDVGGVRYSHIVDPKTGYGLTRRTSATVIAPARTFCLRAEAEQAAIEQHYPVEALGSLVKIVGGEHDGEPQPQEGPEGVGGPQADAQAAPDEQGKTADQRLCQWETDAWWN